MNPSLQELASAYAQLGNWKSVPQEDCSQVWTRSGVEGARWLVDCLGAETNVEVLSAASRALGQIGPPAVPVIFTRLQSGPECISSDHATVLLRALRSISLNATADLHSCLDRYRRHPDALVREAVYYAAHALPRHDVTAFLEKAVRDEHDKDLHAYLNDLLAERRRDLA